MIDDDYDRPKDDSPMRDNVAGDVQMVIQEYKLKIVTMRYDLVITHGLYAMDSPIADERAFKIKHPSLTVE